MSTAIKIENVGPIEAVDIPLPPGGGVVVLRGANGVGKTTALEATQRVLGGNQQLSSRDGQAKGQVSGLGVKITVGRSTRKTGELEAVHLEGKLSIAELVDPGLKSDAAADATRIKAMVALTGAKADENLFRKEIGDDLYDRAVNDDKSGLGLLEMTTRIKADLHGLARRCEKEAVSKQGQADGYRKAAGGALIVDGDVDEASLKTSLLETAKQETTLRVTRSTGVELSAKADAASEALDQHGSPSPKLVEEIRKAREDAIKDRKNAEEAVRKAEWAEANAAAVLCQVEREVSNAAEHYQTIANFERFVCPSEEAVEDAAKAAREASEAWDRAVLSRDAIAKRALADECAKDAAKADQVAIDARDAARACDTVVEQAIDSDVLLVRDGRLYVSTSRGETLFCELSDGERWEIAIDLAANRVGQHGLLVVPQSAWEGFDITNRELIASRAMKRQVTIITAEAQRQGEPAELHADILTTKQEKNQ